MGATLPLLVGALAARQVRLGPALGHLYGLNTLGAVAGVAGAELLLIGAFGVTGSAVCAALLCLAAAVAALTAARRENQPIRSRHDVDSEADHELLPATPDAARRSRRRGHLLASAFVSGAILLALEVIWFRFLTMYVLSTTLAASLMLAVVLAAIGLGGLAAAAWLRWRPGAEAPLPVVAMLTGCAVIGSYAAFEGLTEGTQIEAWHRIVRLASVLTLLPSMLSGVLFTLLGDALQRHVGGRDTHNGPADPVEHGRRHVRSAGRSLRPAAVDRDGGRVLRSRRRLRSRRDPRRAGGRSLAYAPARAGLRRLHVRSGDSFWRGSRSAGCATSTSRGSPNPIPRTARKSSPSGKDRPRRFS